MSKSPFRPVLTTDADVTAMWRKLIRPLGWHNQRQYLVFVDRERKPLPQIIEIDDIPPTLTTDGADALMRMVAHLVPGPELDSVAILLCRPGIAMLTDDDRASGRELYDAARRAGVPVEVLHLGADDAIVPLPMDEVIALPA